MLKKFASSLLIMLVLAGCTSPQEEEVKIEKPTSTYNEQEEETNSKASKIASELVNTLGMQDTTEPLSVVQAINGLFFQGDDSLTSDACVYTSSDPHNSDTVAVFMTKKSDAVKEHINQYIESTKANAESYAGDQVTKFDHAVIENNSSMVVLVIADDSAKAKDAVDAILK